MGMLPKGSTKISHGIKWNIITYAKKDWQSCGIKYENWWCQTGGVGVLNRANCSRSPAK